MPATDNLGTRMKTFYEQVSKTRLVRRMPVAIRLDGKAFHTFTRGMNKPFDAVLIKSMQQTMMYLCNNIQGCVFGYTQSDEITLILIDYQTLESSAWFDYEVQKLCSVAASMATLQFNRVFRMNVKTWEREHHDLVMTSDHDAAYAERLEDKIDIGAMFDARCFNIPKEEVCNLVYWRQLDAMRNSVQMVGQANFSHKELQGKSCAMIRDMLQDKDGVKSWEEYSIMEQRGTAAYKDGRLWTMDTEMPILKGEDRNYVDKHIYVGEE